MMTIEPNTDVWTMTATVGQPTSEAKTYHLDLWPIVPRVGEMVFIEGTHWRVHSVAYYPALRHVSLWIVP